MSNGSDDLDKTQRHRTPPRDHLPPPTNTLVTPLLTDLYQLTMAYAYWKTGHHEDQAVFELFFRKNPFGGEYTIFCGLDQVLQHLDNFKFSESDIEFLRASPALSHCDAEFFQYLKNLNCRDIEVHSMREGTVAFPRVPLLVVSGPLIAAQLLETTLLTLVNFPSLVATNAARMVVAARGKQKLDVASSLSRATSHASLTNPTTTTAAAATTTGTHSSQKQQEDEAAAVAASGVPGGSITADSIDELVLSGEPLPAQCWVPPKCVEFGLRRAQGPDGGFSASKYCIIGGFAGTSNVQAGKLLGVNLAGTHAHSFVQSHFGLSGVTDLSVVNVKTGLAEKLLPRVLEYRTQIEGAATTNDGELAAFITYATAFPDAFLCLIDTYDTLQSGLLNFVLVSLALDDLGHTPRGIRLDSGDLAYLSMECAKKFQSLSAIPLGGIAREFFRTLEIVASNDINEEVLHSLNKQGHAITIFGIGTNLVTCQAQPALGCVYKLVEVNGKARIKLSQDFEKVLIPGRKKPYRLFGVNGWPLLDLLVTEEEPAPQAGLRVLCRHPFHEQKRVAVTSQRVEALHTLVYAKERGVVVEPPNLIKAKAFVAEQLDVLRPDMLRPLHPGQYKVSVSESLFRFLHSLWYKETPVVELH